jgi:hypothetical protein
MAGVVVVVILALIVAAGIFWGRNTIQNHMSRTDLDEQQLEKLHQLKK